MNRLGHIGVRHVREPVAFRNRHSGFMAARCFVDRRIDNARRVYFVARLNCAFWRRPLQLRLGVFAHKY